MIQVDELNAELIKAKATQQELELNLDTMRIKLESASNGAGVELARYHGIQDKGTNCGQFIKI